MKNIDALIIAAMKEEMAPFLDLIESCHPKPIDSPVGTAYQASKGSMRMVLLVTGIGMSACSAALGWALAHFTPKVIVSIGSAGGLARDSRVGQIVVGSNYIHGGADGTAFGYVRGQVPGQPETFSGDPLMLEAVANLIESGEESVPIRVGQMLSSDAFITERNVRDTRQAFPSGLSADMESHAAAQTAHAWGIPFISIRGISDLCGDPDDQSVSFHTELAEVATRAARVACHALQNSGYISLTRCTTQRFSPPTLTSALYFMLARRYELAAGNPEILNDANMAVVHQEIDSFAPDVVEKLVGEIAAGKAFAQQEPNSALTAKDYDRLRAEFLASLPDDSQTETFTWPPTSQTIIKRFDGYWNEALTSIGLVPRQGRSRGGVKYSESDYQAAITQYLQYAQENDSPPSFAGYSMFTKLDSVKGSVPSGAAIRQHFGSWTNALRSAK